MKIASAQVEMVSSHVASERHEIRESLRMWVGPNRPNFEGRGNVAPMQVDISAAGRAAQQADTVGKDDESLDKDPRMLMLIDLIEFLTGRKVKIFNSSELRQSIERVAPPENPQQRPAGYGVEYERHEILSESEQTNFAANGVVQTSDGRTIKFDVQLSMERSYTAESNESLRLGDAVRKKDPIVLNFGGKAAQLTDVRFQFDLDADGTMENINFVTGGSGFLVFDRNHDGKVNNGTELFGPTTGDGFKELASLDDDHNGWIDENDAVYADLRVWTKDASGKDQLQDLKTANVGAVALASIDTPFEIKDAANRTQGSVRASGVFLKEDGGAGSVQQIDLTV